MRQYSDVITHCRLSKYGIRMPNKNGCELAGSNVHQWLKSIRDGHSLSMITILTWYLLFDQVSCSFHPTCREGQSYYVTFA